MLLTYQAAFARDLQSDLGRVFLSVCFHTGVSTGLTQSKRQSNCWLSGLNKLLHQVQMDTKGFIPFAPDEEACFFPKNWFLPPCVSFP